MTSELEASNFECNDQALHIHHVYSGKQQDELTTRAAGNVHVVLNEELCWGLWERLHSNDTMHGETL